MDLKNIQDRMQTFACRILSDEDHLAYRSGSDFNLESPPPPTDFNITKNCDAACREERVSYALNSLRFFTQTYRARLDAYERKSFGIDVAESASEAYEFMMDHITNIYEIQEQRHKTNPRIYRKLCSSEEYRMDIAFLRSLKSEADKLVSQSRPFVQVSDQAAETMESRRSTLKRKMHREMSQFCHPPRNPYIPLSRKSSDPQYESAKTKEDFSLCQKIRLALNENSEGTSVSAMWNIGTAFISGDSADIVQTLDKELKEHPWIRYYLIDNEGLTTSAARSIVSLIDQIDGLHPTERNFLLALFGKEISQSEVELLVSKQTLDFINSALAIDNLLGRVRLYSKWVEENPTMAKALEKWIRENYDPFREMIAYSVENSESLAPKQKELISAIIRDPALSSPDLPLNYADLVIDLAFVDFDRDPLAVVKRITDFTYNPDRKKVVDSGKELVERHFTLIQDVTIEALETYYERNKESAPGPHNSTTGIKINGQELTENQFVLVKLLIQSAKPEDFNYIIDFALKLGRNEEMQGKFSAWFSLLKDPKAVGLTREFVESNFEAIRAALIDTLQQFKLELRNPEDPILTANQYDLLEALLANSTAESITASLEFAHNFLLTENGGKKVDLIMEVIKDGVIADQAKSFAKDPRMHDLVVSAARDTLHQFENLLVESPGIERLRKADPIAYSNLESKPPLTRNEFQAILHLLDKSSPDAINAIAQFAQDLLNTSDWKKRFSIIQDFLKSSENIEGLKSLLSTDEELAIFARALSDIMEKNHEKLVTGKADSPLSESQFFLLQDLMGEPNAEILHKAFDYAHRYVRNDSGKESFDILREMLADEQIFASLQKFSSGKERTEHLRKAMIEAFAKRRDLLLSEDVGLSTSQYDFISLVISEIESEGLRDAFLHAHEFAKAKTTSDRFRYFKEIFVNSSRYERTKRFLTDPSHFRTIQQAMNDTLAQFRSELISGDDPTLTENQYQLARVLVDEVGFQSMLTGFDFLQAWLNADTKDKRMTILYNLLNDRSKFPAMTNFVQKHFSLVRSVALELLMSERKSILEAGVSAAEYDLVLALVRESSKEGFNDAISIANVLMNTPNDRDALIIAIRDYFKGDPKRRVRLISLLESPALEPIKSALQEYIAQAESLNATEKDHLSRLVRGSTARGLTTILEESEALFDIMTDPTLRVRPHVRNTGDEWVMRFSELSKRYPKELRQIVEENAKMLRDVSRATETYLNDEDDEEIDPDLRKVIISFLRGFRGERSIKEDPDPNRWHPFFQLGFQRDRAYELIYEELARTRGVSVTRVKNDIEWERKGDHGGSTVFIEWRGKYVDIDHLASRMQYPLTEQHAVRYAEWGAQELGYAIFKGKRLEALDVEAAKQYMDQLIRYLKQSDETKPYIAEVNRLKGFIERYYDAGLSPAQLTARRAAEQKPAWRPQRDEIDHGR